MGVHALRVSPDGTRLLVAHTAQFVGTQERFGVAIIDIDTPTATVDPWYTTFWKDTLTNSGGTVRVTDAAWGPDGSGFVTSNTGGDKPPANDSVQRFDVAVPLPAAVTWVNRQFDSSDSITTDSAGTVYVGGHFRYTDAPGSDLPYPGDPNTNYGWGPAGGARVLVPQLAYRYHYHVDALDSATGRALNWYSSADGQHGITALLVAGNALLIGDDGQHVDGQASGRSGMASLYTTAYDPQLPHSIVSQPALGAILNVGGVPRRHSVSVPAKRGGARRDGRLKPERVALGHLTLGHVTLGHVTAGPHQTGPPDRPDPRVDTAERRTAAAWRLFGPTHPR